MHSNLGPHHNTCTPMPRRARVWLETVIEDKSQLRIYHRGSSLWGIACSLTPQLSGWRLDHRSGSLSYSHNRRPWRCKWRRIVGECSKCKPVHTYRKGTIPWVPSSHWGLEQDVWRPRRVSCALIHSYKKSQERNVKMWGCSGSCALTIGVGTGIL